jgi:RNA polymerase sigma-54 factor
MGVTVDAVARAADQIAGLEPSPGRAFDRNGNPFVKPELTILREPGGDFAVTMVEDSLPRLRISSHYKSLLADGRQPSDLQQYIREKIRGGKFIIQSIHQRQQTLFQIATEILRRQRSFFEMGRAHLKPLTMAQVGEAVGVHETTVSRAVAGKYVMTPHGIMEMKGFFSTGLASSDGEMSNNSVKQTLAEMIRQENPAKPMSDEALTRELNRRGIQIKRRTVAKYREELHILPSHLRKQYR